MSPEERESLLWVMARAVHPEMFERYAPKFQGAWLRSAAKMLDALESAGYRITARESQ